MARRVTTHRAEIRRRRGRDTRTRGEAAEACDSIEIEAE